MAIHTLSIGGTSYVIEPKYASSAGYAATAGNAKYASSATYATTAAHAVTAGNTKYAATAGHAVTAGNAKYASSATYASSANTASYAVTAGNAKYASTASYASSAGYADYAYIADYATTAGNAPKAATVRVIGVDTAKNYPLVFTDSIPGVSGTYQTLATDTLNSLHYNPNTNLLTVPSFSTSALGVSGGVTIYNGSNFNLRASSTAATDPGDIVFSNSSNTELGRLWLDQGSVFKLRYGSSDAAKTIIHEGNIGDYLTTQSMKTLKIATSQNAGTADLTYASYDGSSDVTIDMVAAARKANTASCAVTAYRALYAGSASNATLAGRAVSSSYAISASHAVTAGCAITAGTSKETWTNVSTSTFYIAGSTTSTSGTSTLYKNTAVKVESNSVRASGGFYETSDARLKTITNDVEVDFERLKSIPKVQYIKKGETAPHIGTIAQDLQKVYPEFVETGDDGYLVVDYAKLSMIPLKAVDMLYDEVNKLKDELKTVKEENQTLKERLDNIEKLINN